MGERLRVSSWLVFSESSLVADASLPRWRGETKEVKDTRWQYPVRETTQTGADLDF
jgi:hypothetical protein